MRFSIGECNEVTRMIVKSEGRLSEEQKKVIKRDTQEKKQALRDLQDDFGSTTADLKRTLDSVLIGEIQAEQAKKELVEANLRLVVSIREEVHESARADGSAP